MSSSKPAADEGWDWGRIGLCLLTLAALLFGGASRHDVMAPLVPRLVAIALLAWALWSASFDLGRWSRLEKALWLLILAVPLIQLIPMPYGTWTALPGREFPRDLYAALSLTPAQPLSLAPDRTINAFLALLPPFAAYVLARRSDRGLFTLMTRIIAVAALFNAALGLLQIVAGVGKLRPYAITNDDLAVGLFANANHFASLLLVGLFALILWMRDSLNDTGSSRAPLSARINRDVLILGAGALLILVALWFSDSRAAMLILALSAVVASALAAAARLGLTLQRMALISAGVVVAALVGAILIAPNGTMTQLAALLATEDRARNFPIFVRMIGDLFPFGAGMGSFDGIFKAYEPVEYLVYTYLNNAHNDYAQLLIEAGLAAAVGLILFAIWWLRAGLALLARGASARAADLRLDLFAFAGTGVVLIHSFGEYPLRTTADAVIFAILCARLAQSRDRAIQV